MPSNDHHCRQAREPSGGDARLTAAQRVKLDEQRRDGWRLAFVRGTPAVAHVVHPQLGYAILTRDARLFHVRRYGIRSEAAPRGTVDSGHGVRPGWLDGGCNGPVRRPPPLPPGRLFSARA